MGINKEEINGKKFTIAREVLYLEKYDMYYVKFPMKDGTIRQVRVFCEKGTFPDRESEQFKEYQRRYGRELVAFFGNSLVGKESLMDEQKREDFIYLGGEFMQKGHLSNRFMVQSNGRTGQENFDANLFKIKQQVSAMENKQASSRKNIVGKNYVCSDIHGMYRNYMNAINSLQPEDVLWVLGDAEDKGNNGIPILLDIISRSGQNGKKPQVRYILGNHDFILLDCINAARDANITDIEMSRYLENLTINRYFYWATEGKNLQGEESQQAKDIIRIYGPQIETIRRQIDEIDKKMGKERLKILENGRWNENEQTLKDYYKLDKQDKEKIISFLKDSPLFITRQFGDKKVALVHAAPPEMEPQTGISITYSDIINSGKSQEEKERLIDSIVWDRRSSRTVKERFLKWYNAGYTTIYGHTNTWSGKVEKNIKDGSIAIDTDSYYNGLTLYCIENGKTRCFYQESRGNESEPIER